MNKFIGLLFAIVFVATIMFLTVTILSVASNQQNNLSLVCAQHNMDLIKLGNTYQCVPKVEK